MAKPVVTSKTYKEKAIFNGVTIWLNSDNSIEINDSHYSSVKEGLRDLASKAGLEVESSWTTQQLGKKLIAHINGKQ